MTINIDSVVTDYQNTVKASVDVYAQLAKNAGARLTNAQPQPTTTWMDDALKWWSTATQDMVNVMAVQQKFAAEAAKK